MTVVLPLVLALLAVAPDKGAIAARGLEKRAAQLQREGQYREAEQPLLEAVKFWTKRAGAQSVDVASDEMSLAVSYRRRGDALLAVPMLERVAATLKEATAADAPELYRSALNNLGAAYYSAGRSKDARKAWEDCLALAGEGAATEERARILDNLANALLDEGLLAEAEPYSRKGLAAWQELKQGDDVDVGISMSVLGAILQRRNRLPQARPLLEGSLAMLQRVLGDDHPEVGAALNLLAALDVAEGRLEVARVGYTRAITLSRKAGLAETHANLKDAVTGLKKIDRIQARR
jgi:tetratricopeptide (TPR) repeat protein